MQLSKYNRHPIWRYCISHNDIVCFHEKGVRNMSDNLTNMECTHNCSTCGSACGTEKKGKSFFDKLEMVSDAYSQLDEEEVLKILNDTIAEWEKEEEA